MKPADSLPPAVRRYHEGTAPMAFYNALNDLSVVAVAMCDECLPPDEARAADAAPRLVCVMCGSAAFALMPIERR